MPQCLIVDDLPVIRRIARVITEDCGFEVREAEHGRQAFELCTMSMPDVILLDWKLPVMGAYEFLKALRTFGPRHWPYVIYCTTEFDFIDVQRARAAGVADTLMKPFDRSMLRAKLERYTYLAIARMSADPDLRHDAPRNLERVRHGV